MKNNFKYVLTIFLVITPLVCYAQDNETLYVTDQFEITLHTSKDPNSKVIKRLKSGEPVTILQEAGSDGYAKVSAPGNSVGWVLESFLMSQPSGRDQYRAVKKEYDKLKAEFDQQVKLRTAKLSKELEQTKRVAKKPLKVQEENERLKKALDLERKEFEQIKRENQEFKSIYKDRLWLITGAVIAIGSLVLGLVITRIPWRRRKRWGEV